MSLPYDKVMLYHSHIDAGMCSLRGISQFLVVCMLEETKQQRQLSSVVLFSRMMMFIMICSFILSGCGSSSQKDTALITADTSSSQQSPIASATSIGKPTASIKVIDAQTSLSSYPGGYMTMSISTGPAAICTITVYYGLNTPSKSFGIIPVTADRNGIASWHWKVPSSAPVGIWPLTISAVQVNGTKITTQVNVTVL
jgi:hypothetical protein